MAINDIVQTIAEARVDARSLSEFVFKPADFMVKRRQGGDIHTLRYYLDSFDETKTIISAYVATIPSIVNDAINNTAVEGGILADTFVTITVDGEGSVATNLRDLKRKLKLEFANVDAMLAGNVPKNRVASSGRTTWRRINVTIPTALTDFIPLNGVWVADFNVDALGVSDSTGGVQAAINAAGYANKVKWTAGNYLLTSALDVLNRDFIGSERFNSTNVTLTSSAIPVLRFTKINSLRIDGFNILSTAILSPLDSVVELTGCTYYSIKNMRVQNSHNTAINKTGTAIRITAHEDRFSGYGVVESTVTPNFDTGIYSDNTIISFKGISCDHNRVGLELHGEIAHFDSCDIASNTEWGIDSSLTVSLTGVNTYNENVSLNNLIRANIQPSNGINFIGGKQYLARVNDHLIYSNIGNCFGHDIASPVKNNGTVNTINLLANPLGDIDTGGLGRYSSTVTQDTADKPSGAVSSTVLDFTATTVYNRTVDSFMIPSNTGVSQSIWVKRETGVGTMMVWLANSVDGSAIRFGRIDINLSMSPVGEWVQIVVVPTPQFTNVATEVKVVRFVGVSGNKFKIAKHVASVGKHIFDSSHTPLTKELGGVISAKKLALPNLPTDSTYITAGDLWVDGNTVRVKNVLKNVGTTENRPVTPPTGFYYFDTTLAKPIFYRSGGVWVDGSGVAL